MFQGLFGIRVRIFIEVWIRGILCILLSLGSGSVQYQPGSATLIQKPNVWFLSYPRVSIHHRGEEVKYSTHTDLFIFPCFFSFLAREISHLKGVIREAGFSCGDRLSAVNRILRSLSNHQHTLTGQNIPVFLNSFIVQLCYITIKKIIK